MKRLTLSLMLLTATSVGTMAKSVVFTLSSGEKVYYLLGATKDPMLKFQDGGITVNADTYEFSGVKISTSLMRTILWASRICWRAKA